MKITSYDIHAWAKEASAKFVKEDVSLNKSLTKIAQEHGLNQQQVNRLVERANAATYVSKMNEAKGDEKYIEFPVAESSKIAIHLDYQESAPNLLDDYRKPPEQPKVDNIKLSQLFPGLEEKEDLKLTDNQKYLIKKAAVEALNKIETTKREIAMIFDLESDKFINNIKFASLTPDTNYKDVSEHLLDMSKEISSVIKPLVKRAEAFVPERLREKNSDDIYDMVELEKQAEYLKQIVIAYKNLDNNAEELVKQAATGAAFGLLGRSFASLFRGGAKVLDAASKNRLAMAGILGAGGLAGGAGLTAAYVAGEEKVKQELSPLKRIPPRYNMWRG